jgi:hypothetical protein
VVTHTNPGSGAPPSQGPPFVNFAPEFKATVSAARPASADFLLVEGRPMRGSFADVMAAAMEARR